MSAAMTRAAMASTTSSSATRSSVFGRLVGEPTGSRARGACLRVPAGVRRARPVSRPRVSVLTFALAGSDDAETSIDANAPRRLKIFSVNDVYELQNLSALKCFIQDNVQPGEAYLCTLNGDFLSPSLLSSLDLGAAAVSAMNAIPVTHACLGNHEFDHSIEILGQRLGELNCEVINTNVFACPEGEEHLSLAATKRAMESKTGEPRPRPRPGVQKSQSKGVFLDDLPRSSVVHVGGVKIGLLGLCTTSTPLSSARKPKGVVFAECVPLARREARKLLPLVDALVALTHQTLPEDARLAEEVPEIAAILGGHEHTPFAGRMGHGANAAAKIFNAESTEFFPPKSLDARRRQMTECINEEAGTLCVKAGMDAENVVVVTIEVPDARSRGNDRGGACDADAAAAALDACAASEAKAAAVADAAREHRDEFGRGGLWSRGPAAGPAAGSEMDVDDARDDAEASRDGSQSCEIDFETDETACLTLAVNNVVPTIVDPIQPVEKSATPSTDEATDGRPLRVVDESPIDAVPIPPGAELGGEVAVVRPGSRVRVSARMYSLRGYRTDPAIDLDIWQRSEVLRGLNRHTLSLHEHAKRLGLTPLSSKDSRSGQCSLGTLFATILRDECRADVCLYNSGGIRGNRAYGDEALTYGDLVAEVPFENNIVALEMTGAEVERAVAFSEAEQIRKSREGGSWGGYLQWDEGVEVEKTSDEKVSLKGSDDLKSARRASPLANAETRFEYTLRAVRGGPFDPRRTYRVVTWAGLLDGADDIPAFRDIGRKISSALAKDARGGGGGCGGEAENPEEVLCGPAISGSDGIPFKILVVKHLARRRWRELLDKCSFESMDTDEDGSLRVVDVSCALQRFTESVSYEQEAEAMVRSFDVDGDGAVTRRDVLELLEHFDDSSEVDLWRRVDARKFERSAESRKSRGGKPKPRKNGVRRVGTKIHRGEEIQARGLPEEE